MKKLEETLQGKGKENDKMGKTGKEKSTLRAIASRANNDICHFLSSATLFLSFMILLALDDDLDNIPRDKIPEF